MSYIIHQPLGSRNLSFSDEYPPNLPRNRGDFKGEMAHTSFVKTDKIPRLFVLFLKFQTRRPKNFLQQKLKLKHKHKEALLPNRYKNSCCFYLEFENCKMFSLLKKPKGNSEGPYLFSECHTRRYFCCKYDLEWIFFHHSRASEMLF